MKALEIDLRFRLEPDGTVYYLPFDQSGYRRMSAEVASIVYGEYSKMVEVYKRQTQTKSLTPESEHTS